MEIRLCGGRTHGNASTSLTQLSGPACAAQVFGSALPAGIPSPENASAGFVCRMDGLHPQVCHRAAPPWSARSADHPAPSIAPVRTSGAAGPVSDLEGGLLRVCQTAPAVPAHAGDVAGTAWAHVPDGRGAPPVARHECLYSGALLAHPTQTPPAWFVGHHS